MIEWIGWIVGTIILWVLKLALTIPIARKLSTSAGIKFAAEDDKEKPDIPAKYYIPVDILILGVAGFLISALTGYYFIGISLSKRDIPGMIIFIIASLMGAFA